MPIKILLMPIRESDFSDELMETGLIAAKRFNAHLDLLYVHPNPEEMLAFGTFWMSSSIKASVVESAERNAADQAKRLKSAFDELCERHEVPQRFRGESPGNVSAGWLEEHGPRDAYIGCLGRLADVVIMPKPSRTEPLPSSFEAAVRETGRPVLMVPRKAVTPVPAKHVAIGWNNSKEAAQAIAAARPCLREADSVTVMVTEKRFNQRPSADEVVTYLKCHGVEAKIEMLDVRNRSVGEALLAQSKDNGADLLVVGGYSRSRVREMVMGGVTAHVLEHAELPVMMYH